jgi:hypothetical protein
MVQPVLQKGTPVEWLLMLRVKDDVSWSDAATSFLKSKLGADAFTPPQVHNIVHMQTTRQGAWERVVFFTSSLSKINQGNACICQDKSKKGIRWLPLSQLDAVKAETKIWGPRLAKTLESAHPAPGHISFTEFSTFADKDKRPVPGRMTLCRRHKPKPSEHDMEIILSNDGSLVKRNVITAGKISDHSLNPSVQSLNGLLTMVRECFDYHRKPKKGLDWYEDEDKMSKIHIPAIKTLMEKAKSAFKTEPRVLRIQQPVHVLGDIHGNLSDVIHFENVLWGPVPDIQASRFLFLGKSMTVSAHRVSCDLMRLL